MPINWGTVASVAVPSIIAGGGGAIAVLRLWGEGWIKHHFDRALADVNAKHQSDLTTLTSKLNQQADQINTLQSGALATMISRHQALDARQQIAVDRVWEVATKIHSLTHYLPMIGAMVEVYKNLESMSPVDKAKIAKMVEDFGLDKKDDELTTVIESAQHQQLYLDAVTWQTFSSLKNVFVYGRLQMKLMSSGHNPLKHDISKSIIEPIATVLPEQKDYLAEQGEAGAYNLAGALYVKLWRQLRSVLDGEETDRKLLRGTEILMAASYQTDLPLGGEKAIPNEIQEQIDKTKPKAE